MPDMQRDPNIAEILDRPTDPARCSAGAVLRMLGAGLISAAVFGATPLRIWAERLPPSTTSERIVAVTTGWDDAMQLLGPGRLFGALRQMSQAARERPPG